LRDVQHANPFQRGPPRAHIVSQRGLRVPTSEVLFESAGPVAFLTFNRPEARNALTWAMYEALAAACDRADSEAIRVLVIRATGDPFAAGTDIHQFAGFATADDGLDYERRLDAVIDRLERVRGATIAQVQGVAAGGGCAIALACDLRVCTPAARFGVPIARTLGNCLSSANYARLVDAIGPARAKDLLFTARFLDASEADAAGLVTRMTPPERLDAVVRELAETIAAHAPATIRATKEAIRRIAEKRRERVAIDDLVSACYGSEDFKEGVAAFIARRAPRFTGR
jgi:enoyl-CoA hydratase/carnithine racemase